MITVEKKRIAQELYDFLESHFPEIKLVGIVTGPEDPTSIRVEVVMPDDEDREEALRALAAERVTDLMIDRDLDILVRSDLFDIMITLPEARQLENDDPKTYRDLEKQLARFLYDQKAGNAGRFWRGSPTSSPKLFGQLKDLQFGRKELPDFLKGKLEEPFEIYWVPPESDDIQQLYPPLTEPAAER